jgi:site-specific DNA-methyltransferase (adenine-specific)
MIIHSNCEDVPLDLIAECDVMITDPPYSPHVHENATSTRTGGVGPEARDLGFAALTPSLRDYIAACARVMKRWSVVFTDFEGFEAWRTAMAAADLEYIRPVPWIRWSQPQISGDRPPTGAELVGVWHAMGPRGPRGGDPRPLKKRWNGGGGLTHFDQRCMRGLDKHPTEKPLDLMLELVADFSDPGETVFDPCVGRGTTALACRILGRNCVGVERDATEAALAEAREAAPLTPRDRVRAIEWAAKARAEAEAIPEPADDSMAPCWERAQRKIDAVARVESALG